VKYDTATDYKVWSNALAFLWEETLKKFDLGPLQKTDDKSECTVTRDPHFRKTRVTITFWVVPK